VFVLILRLPSPHPPTKGGSRPPRKKKKGERRTGEKISNLSQNPAFHKKGKTREETGVKEKGRIRPPDTGTTKKGIRSEGAPWPAEKKKNVKVKPFFCP